MELAVRALPALLLVLALLAQACSDPALERPASYRALHWNAEQALLSLGEASGEVRRASTLSAGQSLRLTLHELPPAASLGFALGRPEQALPPGADLEIELRERAPGGEWTSRRVLLPVAPGDPSWYARRLQLAAPAGSSLELELHLPSGRDGEQVLVAESALLAAGRRARRVLLITSDTHRADHLGASGAVDAPLTPTLDTLAARGVLFEDCLAPTNVTNPSHMSLFTGVHPRDLGIDDNSVPLSARADTLAEHFAAQGFRTLALVSARHLGDPESGLGQGFERMSWPTPRGERAAPPSLSLAQHWLTEVGDEPLFVWVHLFDAHRPYRAPQRWREHYWSPERDPADPTLPPLDVSAEVLPEPYRKVRDLDYLRALYKAEVSFLDEELGTLLEHPALRDAAVALTADHGESLGAHGIHFGHAGLFPDTLHVPLLLVGPGMPAGVRVSEPVSHADLGATLLKWGAVSDVTWPGRDLRRLAEPATSAVSARAAPRFALSAHGFSASLTYEGWHLILQLRDEQQPVMSERFLAHELRLYDLRDDPRCETELSEQQPEHARQLRARLIAWLQAAQGLDLAGSASEDQERLDRLAELGYLAPSETPSSLWIPDACARCRRWD